MREQKWEQNELCFAALFILQLMLIENLCTIYLYFTKVSIALDLMYSKHFLFYILIFLYFLLFSF